MELCNATKCTGCRSCENTCPKGAISMKLTVEGKTVPVIDSEKCVDCSLCQKACPVLFESDFIEPIKCLAAWTLDENDRKTCASGGIATGLYRSILDNAGVIYGCDYDKALKPVIRRSESINDLEKFKSSKYVQSSTESSYKEVKKDLQDGRNVLYVGTPCQIDGLNHFLGRKYDGLLTVDIICHGVPPYKYLHDYISDLKLKKTPNNVSFRGKNDYFLAVYRDDELLYMKESEDDFYFKAFLSGMIFRDNCYECRYARKERISDLTIGDFWRLNKKKLQTPCPGKASVILANTSKGMEALEKASSYIYFEEKNLEEALIGNDQLNHPMPVHQDRQVFVNNLNKGVYRALLCTDTGKAIKKKQVKEKLGKIKRKLWK
jgi:coenzyme F420-reducing hydrogenase beta subunit